MKVFSNKILLINLLIGLICLSACKSEEPADLENEVNRFDNPRVTMTISPISMSPVNEGVIEKIRTLRIIMLAEQTLEDNSTVSYVEFNRLIDFQDSPTFSGPGEYASYFRYVFTRATVPGIKKFYLIANESSVGNVSFQIDENNEENFPEGLPAGVENGMNITDFLDIFSPNYIPGYDKIPGLTNGEGEPRGEEFENLINCLYYTAEFNTEDEGQSIFLPYSAFYQYELATYDPENSQAQNVLNETMYLVPAANKFIFKFRNYRPAQLIITSFKLSGMATDMYLFGQVNSDDQQKSLNGIKLWWIDWMAGVSRLSYPENSSGYPEGPDNEVFNQTYGWIDKFNIPNTAFDPQFDEEINLEPRKGVTEFIPEGDTWAVDSRDMSAPINTAQPGTAITDYYYLPESRYTVPQNILDENQNIVGTTLVQRYFLTMTMRDNKVGALTVTKDTPIGNLGSMFRGNNTLITVTLRDANDVGAYAQPERWKESHSFGNVIEEETP